MSGVDVALAAIPVLVDEVRALRRELGELRAIVGEPGTRWVTQTEWARANGISTDTVARKVAAGEIEVREIGRKPMVDKAGKPLVDKHGAPRFRRCLRLKLSPPVSDIEVRQIAKQMVRAQ